MFCIKCGTDNSDSAKFCRKCGQPMYQPKSAPETAESRPVTPPPQAAAPVSKPPSPAIEPQVQPVAVNPPPTVAAVQTASVQASQQPAAAQAAPADSTTGLGIQPNIAAALCYVVGWVTGIVFLVVGGKNEFIKFHAWQSIITFGSLSILSIIFQIFALFFRSMPLPLVIIYYLVLSAFSIFMLVVWIMLMIKAYQSKLFKLPVIGDIAIQMMKKYSNS